jgi:hypothetical protein
MKRKESGLERMAECIRQLREGRGPYFDRWLRGIVAGVSRKRVRPYFFREEESGGSASGPSSRHKAKGR